MLDSLHTIEQAHQWLQQGHAVHLFTVLKTWGSSPRPPGSFMAIRDDGIYSGSVSGGCIEGALLERLSNNQLAAHSSILTFESKDAQPELPCGADLHILHEPLLRTASSPQSTLVPLLKALQSHTSVCRRIMLNTGAVSYISSPANAVRVRIIEESQNTCIEHTLESPWALLLIGAGDIARHLLDFTQRLGFHVYLCEPRQIEYDSWNSSSPAHCTLTRAMPDDAVLEMLSAHSPSQCAVAALSHDPKLDDMALLEALPSSAFYVAAIGSNKNQTKRRQRLLQLDLSKADVERLSGPAGLDIGSHTPAEIALSIAAELLAYKHGKQP